MRCLRVMAAVLLAVLCGCAPASSPIEERPVPLQAFPAIEQPVRQTMIFLTANEDDLYTGAAQLFADHVSDLTGGNLTVELVYSADPLTDFAAGGGDFLLVDSVLHRDFCPDFPPLTLPLLYRDYEHFTMGVNSARLLELVADSMAPADALPLAGFYQTGNYLVTARPRESGNLVLAQPQDGGDPEEEGVLVQTPVAAVVPGSNLTGLLERFGLEVREDLELEERRRQVFSGRMALGEFTYEEILGMQWEGAELIVLGVGHSVHPRYLVAKSSRYSQLPPEYRAAVDEAMAYLGPHIYDGVTRQRNELAAWLREQGIVVEWNYPALRVEAERYLPELAESDSRTRYIYDVLYSME